MNNAQWNTKFADRKKTTHIDQYDVRKDSLDKTPYMTRKLLEIDEQQLDLLTGQRAAIYKN